MACLMWHPDLMKLNSCMLLRSRQPLAAYQKRVEMGRLRRMPRLQATSHFPPANGMR